jgi:very-short-patch-repair endonuclease
MTDELTADEYNAMLIATGQRTNPGNDPDAPIKAKVNQMPAAKRKLAQWLRKNYVGRLSAEHYFHPDRQWRFDWAIVDARIAVEYDGVFRGKAHTSIKDVMKDQEKHNEAQLLGWIIIRCNANTVNDESAFAWIQRAVAQKEAA